MRSKENGKHYRRVPFNLTKPSFTRPQFKILFSCLNKKNRPQKIAVKSSVKMIRGLNTTIQAFSVSNSLANNKKISPLRCVNLNLQVNIYIFLVIETSSRLRCDSWF